MQDHVDFAGYKSLAFLKKSFGWTYYKYFKCSLFLIFFFQENPKICLGQWCYRLTKAIENGICCKQDISRYYFTFTSLTLDVPYILLIKEQKSESFL